jgi:divalent metal cation (Fe/Co/Zn/Cd) transporter
MFFPTPSDSIDENDPDFTPGSSPNHALVPPDFVATRIAVWTDNAVNLSWAVNCFLLLVKLYASIVSNSKSVWASLADSLVDLLSQAVLSLAEKYSKRHHPEYPVGRSRLEALSVLACAVIMIMASIEVIQFSVVDLYDGLHGNIPVIDIGVTMYVILSIGIIAKFLLYIYCGFVNKSAGSDSLAALAEDHLNDVLSNSAAITTASIAYHATGMT